MVGTFISLTFKMSKIYPNYKVVSQGVHVCPWKVLEPRDDNSESFTL